MTNTNKLLAKFGCEIDFPKEVSNCHPHLEDKMVVDLINGLEVVNDHIKISESHHNPLNRFMDGITGKGKQRQDKINKNLSEGLKTASIWLQKHESDFIQVNLVLETLGSKLFEARAGIMKVDSKVERLKDDLFDFKKAVLNKQTQLDTYIQDVDLRTRADAHLTKEFDFWAGGSLNHMPIELRVFTVLDNLRNGSFTLYLQNKATAEERRDYIKHLKSKIRVAVANDFNEKPGDDLFKKQWFNLDESSNKLGFVEKQSLVYLSSWANKKSHSTVFAVNSLQKPFNNSLPNRHNMLRWMDRNVEEQIGMMRK